MLGGAVVLVQVFGTPGTESVKWGIQKQPTEFSV